MDKSTLRKSLKKKRRAVSPLERTQAAEAISERLSTLPEFKHSQNIACYLAQDGEIDLQHCIELIWQLGKSCFLPVIDTDNNCQKMQFGIYKKQSTLVKNIFNIPEPEPYNLYEIENMHLVLAPLVGFDCHGYRLGMGGGYYDYTLGHCGKSRPFFMGCGYACQQINTCPHEKNDIRMDAILTEHQLIRI